jgi:hypothetical protein
VRPKAVNSSRPANRETYDQPTMSSNTINGIPRVDLHARPLWKRNVAWWMGGQLGSTKHIGPRGGRFVAREVVGAERDELYSLAVDRLHRVFALHEERSDARAIPVMRLEPSQL